ncbi:phenylalanine--tRNA ligase subunit beta [Pectobacterium parmentieri]|uniref:Phenylalanine--tRNA ligase beta subunit n=1 Tax=Pectobacterium parmentieri TaxID=1905730 RepID=A0A0H3I3K0_PECPM|nr:phenylalanine--tRNA ligase subunit beta [Pectobacterium parmentieri]ACX87955.1 phenylalanyl-tRNA synthetase, beta subunit [Pectobacterium parmentieri WPP163]AFI90215.1 Phenylalanyl-tRNA synthetase, beta subunit [Pectobacterium parmentieri]MBI0471589.1 phenylalanine--tRNA ligase subunit beta [Pectobacterium parmentieri]MBI0494274.1 phenylalanine--tRNA ligase subunit beta [Pectobacterium parmentieri]MBI0555496.1 phenylalanine--tRNA ligase subunit beta [Pectobacterium parmentieri]
MKFSELWLREWVNPAVDSETLSEQITMAGLEVDGVEPVAGAFHGVVVGEVVECGQHPNADKLRVTKVNVGGDRLLDIVCGAPNCRHGLKVAVATVGAVLPGDFKIKAAKLRGEPSEGMLCSFSELGISDDHDGIIELPADAPIGTDIRDYLKLDDNAIEISVTPNRADCLGIIGVARDVAVLNQLTLNEPTIEPVAATIQDTFPIRVDAPQACPRYLGRVVKGINVKAATPLWMREKLRRCGIRSIDPVVDVTNYVLLELGQPMHAFDLDRLNGGIIVRMAEEGETLTLLDGNEAKLNADTLVIADQQNALAMGGIFGGEHSGVNDETQNVLLECAYFNPLSITGRARRHGLHTDASHRYERGVDPALQHNAIERATRLLIDICGGDAGPVVDVTSKADLPTRATITLRREKLDRLIGHVIADEQVSDILRRLGCNVAKIDAGWQATAPSWRFDMEIEEDLVEEVARIYGYNNIPNIPTQAPLIMTAHREASLSLKRVKTLLVDHGYQEAITYSFVDPKIQGLIHPDEASLSLPSPISAEMSVMRLSLWSGLLSAAVYNQNRQQSRLRLFESGLRFVPDTSADLGIRQDLMLAGVMTGTRYEEHWDLARQAVDFYDLKGDLEAVLALTGKFSEVEFRAENNPALHPGQSAAIYLCGERIGFIGVIHPELERKLDLNGRTVVFELLWDKVADRVLPDANEISRFPANRRDIAVVVAENVPAGDILAECKKVGANQLVGVNLFDVYRGKGVAEGYKSLAISLTLQDTTRTLAEEEIAATVAECVAALKQRFQASLRD